MSLWACVAGERVRTGIGKKGLGQDDGEDDEGLHCGGVRWVVMSCTTCVNGMALEVMEGLDGRVSRYLYGARKAPLLNFD